MIARHRQRKAEEQQQAGKVPTQPSTSRTTTTAAAAAPASETARYDFEGNQLAVGDNVQVVLVTAGKGSRSGKKKKKPTVQIGAKGSITSLNLDGTATWGKDAKVSILNGFCLVVPNTPFGSTGVQMCCASFPVCEHVST
jgi:hypothetical protein